MDTEPHGELDPVLSRQTGIEGSDGLDNAQAGVHGAPSIVFMGGGVAKIDQQAIPEILGNIPLIAFDDLSRGFLVRTHHGAQVFGVKLAGELCGTHQITEQHRELPPFCVRSTAGHYRGDDGHVV